ncbi:MAG: F0F1 ATP synthase subunit A [Phascolarctobacterium faecium]
MAPFMITLFMFIFIGNELGMLPQIGVHWTSRPMISTLFLRFLNVAFGGYAVGVHQQGIGHFKHFISPKPGFLPIHLLDAITKPLTMALRLFGNILAGEILLIVLYQRLRGSSRSFNVQFVYRLLAGLYFYDACFKQLCHRIS